MTLSVRSDNRILLVEDDAHLQNLLGAQLKARQYEVQIAGEGLKALHLMLDMPPDLVLLDLNLPDIDGLEVCRRIRQKSQTPILIITAIDTPETKIRALELGADGYMTKPFDVAELMSHIQATLRCSRNRQDAAPSQVEVDDLHIDLAGRQVKRGEQIIPLTRTEFDLLKTLVSSPDKLLSYQTLLEAVQGPDCGDVRAVHLTILNLKRKLETHGPNMVRYIISVPGVGYCFRILSS